MNGCVKAGQLELPNLLRATPRVIVESSLACERVGARPFAEWSCNKPVKAPFMLGYYGYYLTRFVVPRFDNALGIASCVIISRLQTELNNTCSIRV